MQGAYGGLIIIILYGSGSSAPTDEFFLLTESGMDILTETLEPILVEV